MNQQEIKGTPDQKPVLKPEDTRNADGLKGKDADKTAGKDTGSCGSDKGSCSTR